MMKKIAIIANDVAMPGEKGLSRLHYLAEFLCDNGFDVEIITADFQHWEKRYRSEADIAEINNKSKCKVTCLHEGAYSRNIEPKRILSYVTLAGNILDYIRTQSYDLIYALVPDNHLAYTAGKYAKEKNIPFIVDVEDLWPEAMRMVIDIPVVSTVLFSYFSIYAKKAYKLADGVVGSSEEYMNEPKKYGVTCPDSVTVYVGNDLEKFDNGVKSKSDEIVKPDGEFWITYAGTLGTSYDIGTLIKAVAELNKEGYSNIKLKLLGDGPQRAEWTELAQKVCSDTEFLGFCSFDYMAAYLSKSDVTVNSLVEKASQSIVSKIGDYLASGKPMINTGLNKEFCNKVNADGFGVNVYPGRVDELKNAILNLYNNSEQNEIMGIKGRKIAEEQFNRPVSYMNIVNLIKKFTV